MPCNEYYDMYCLRNYGNGYCGKSCNNEKCNWNSLDCVNQPRVLAAGSVVLVVVLESEVFLNNSMSFLIEVSHALRTNVRQKMNENIRPMVSPWRFPGSKIASYLMRPFRNTEQAYLFKLRCTRKSTIEVVLS